MPDLADFITTEEAAKLLQYHVEHVRRMLREGDIKGAKIGKDWLVLRTSVEEYISTYRDLNKYDPRRGRH